MAKQQAWVLSGGGTRGAFEAGAVEYLHHSKQRQPDILTGTSAGSICAAVLAQARGPAEFAQVVQVLRQDILAMTHINKVFAESGWVQLLAGTPLQTMLQAAVFGALEPQIGKDPGIAVDPLATIEAVKNPSLLTSVFHMGAITKASKAFWDEPLSIMNLGPLENALKGLGDEGIAPLDEQQIARPGVQLRLTIAGLRSGQVRYVDEHGYVLRSDALTRLDDGVRPGPIEGVLASSSVPGLFTPRPIGDEIYVDGGTLLNMPIEPALALGAERIIAISANTLAPPVTPALDAEKSTLVDVTTRVAFIQFYDQVMRSLQYPLPRGVKMKVIAPTLDVIGPFEVEQELMTLAMDYGWLRAAEVMNLRPKELAAAAQISDQIIIGRQRYWHLQRLLDKLEAEQVVPDVTVTSAVQSALKMINNGMNAWQKYGLTPPVGFDQWATPWHRQENPASVN